MATDISFPLRERAAAAWRERQAQEAEARREWIAKLRLGYRDGLRNAIESTLGISIDPTTIEVPISDEQLARSDADGAGDIMAVATVDGLTLILERRGQSVYLALDWQCPTCGHQPITDTQIRSLEELGSLLEHLPTLCRCRQEGAS